MKLLINPRTLFCTAILLLAIAAKGQQDEKQQVLREFATLINTYYAASSVEFDITYRCSREETPGEYLDSLSGKFKMSGQRYWYRVDSMETIGNKDLVVVLFREDQVMYLSRPGQLARSNNPLAMLDSFFMDNDEYEYAVTDMQQEKKITLTSKKQDAVRKIEYFISRETGLLTRMHNTVNAGLLYDETVRQAMEPANTYVVIEMLFDNYRVNRAGADIPDAANYFKKEGQQYVTLPPYHMYKIFIGSPNL